VKEKMEEKRRNRNRRESAGSRRRGGDVCFHVSETGIIPSSYRNP
jgi:hypothetical protein